MTSPLPPSRRAIGIATLTLVVAALLTVAPRASASTVWVVDSSAPAGCARAVCKTLASALDAAKPGDAIELRRGTQINVQITTSGVAIRRSGDHADPVIKGATRVKANDVALRDLVMEGALFIESGAQRVTVDGVRMTESFVKINDAGPVTIRRSTFAGRYDEDVMQIVNGARDVLVEDSRLSHAHISAEARRRSREEKPHVDCVQMFGGGARITFRRNYIGNCDMSAFMIKSDRGALRDVVFERNFIQDCWPATDACSAPYAMQVFAGTDAHWTQKQPSDPSAYYPLTGLVFRHNTIDGGVIFGNPHVGKVEFLGNVVTAGRGANGRAITGHCGKHRFEQNLFGSPVECDGYTKGSNGSGQVRYVDGAAGDLHLAPGSAGREFGSAHATWPDIDGEPVCGKADAGADETCPGAGGASGPSPTTTAPPPPPPTTTTTAPPAPAPPSFPTPPAPPGTTTTTTTPAPERQDDGGSGGKTPRPAQGPAPSSDDGGDGGSAASKPTRNSGPADSDSGSTTSSATRRAAGTERPAGTTTSVAGAPASGGAAAPPVAAPQSGDSPDDEQVLAPIDGPGPAAGSPGPAVVRADGQPIASASESAGGRLLAAGFALLLIMAVTRGTIRVARLGAAAQVR